MKKNLSKKVLCLITILLIIITLFLLLRFSTKIIIFLFFLFGLAYWQRKRLKSFFQKIKNPKIRCTLYIIAGWLWAIFLELTSGRLAFNEKPIANLIIGLGFYLPFFAIWHKLIKRYQFNFLEVFYLSGFGRLLFDLVITRKLLVPAVYVSNAKIAIVGILARTIAVMTLFGILTTLPSLFLSEQKNDYQKPAKQYLIAMTPNFLAAGVFVIWAIILKIVFT